MITITDTMRKVWKHLISAGLTPEGAAGVMGKIKKGIYTMQGMLAVIIN